jgi:hypothetical protein
MGVVKYSARATAVFVLLIGVAAADAPDFVLGLCSLAASETALLVIAVVRIVAGIVLINGRAFVAPAEDLATLGRATDPWRTAETRDQLAQVAWRPWSPARVRFPAPEQPKPFRCHPMSVSGFAIVRMRRHSISDDSATSVIRVPCHD